MPLGVIIHISTGNDLNNSSYAVESARLSSAGSALLNVLFLVSQFFFLQMGEEEEGKIPYCLHEDLGCILIT